MYVRVIIGSKKNECACATRSRKAFGDIDMLGKESLTKSRKASDLPLETPFIKTHAPYPPIPTEKSQTPSQRSRPLCILSEADEAIEAPKLSVQFGYFGRGWDCVWPEGMRFLIYEVSERGRLG